MKRLLLLGLLAAGCGGDPVDAEGPWNVAGTFRENDCNIPNWNPGDTFNDVDLVVSQNGDAIIGDITGGGGDIYLGILLGGDDVFRGDIDGNDVDLTREGTRPETMGNCTYTYNARLEMTITGDAFSGRLTFVRATNGNSDCAALECSSYQDLSGNRPPT
jgi:hypothetical protein